MFYSSWTDWIFYWDAQHLTKLFYFLMFLIFPLKIIFGINFYLYNATNHFYKEMTPSIDDPEWLMCKMPGHIHCMSWTVYLYMWLVHEEDLSFEYTKPVYLVLKIHDRGRNALGSNAVRFNILTWNKMLCFSIFNFKMILPG